VLTAKKNSKFYNSNRNLNKAMHTKQQEAVRKKNKMKSKKHKQQN